MLFQLSFFIVHVFDRFPITITSKINDYTYPNTNGILATFTSRFTVFSPLRPAGLIKNLF